MFALMGLDVCDHGSRCKGTYQDPVYVSVCVCACVCVIIYKNVHVSVSLLMFSLSEHLCVWLVVYQGSCWG